MVDVEDHCARSSLPRGWKPCASSSFYQGKRVFVSLAQEYRLCHGGRNTSMRSIAETLPLALEACTQQGLNRISSPGSDDRNSIKFGRARRVTLPTDMAILFTFALGIWLRQCRQCSAHEICNRSTTTDSACLPESIIPRERVYVGPCRSAALGGNCLKPSLLLMRRNAARSWQTCISHPRLLASATVLFAFLSPSVLLLNLWRGYY